MNGKKPLTEEDLLTLKRRITQAKTAQSAIQGKRDYLLQEMKTKWECNSIADAEAKMKELEQYITHLEGEIKDTLVAIGAKWHDQP